MRFAAFGVKLPALLLILCPTAGLAEDAAAPDTAAAPDAAAAEVEAGDPVERGAPLGRWSTGGTLIEVTAKGESLSARMIALKHPRYRLKDGRGEVGALKVDDLNPDPSLRQRPLLGLELFSDFQFRRGRWSGRLYSPDSGRTFNTRMWVKDQELHVRGFILGMPWLGRSRSLQPVAACDEDILEMIRISGIQEPACDPL